MHDNYTFKGTKSISKNKIKIITELFQNVHYYPSRPGERLERIEALLKMTIAMFSNHRQAQLPISLKIGMPPVQLAPDSLKLTRYLLYR